MTLRSVHTCITRLDQQNVAGLVYGISVMLAVMAICVIPTVKVSAAIISFDPQETTVGLEEPFLIGVTIEADVPVNAVTLVIDIPESMEVIEISDGDSVINMWVERPHVTNVHTLVFSGIIPGGFTGIGGKLLTLTVRAKQEGVYDFIINPRSRMYENDSQASSQEIISEPLRLSVVQGKTNLSNTIPDTIPPESFVPVIVTIPGDQGDRFAVSFQTQDKMSGVAYYEVAESHRNITVSSRKKIERLPWTRAVAPHFLSGQDRSSYVYVKAVDLRGNARYVKINPTNPPWQGSVQRYILTVLAILIVLYVIFTRIRIQITRSS